MENDEHLNEIVGMMGVLTMFSGAYRTQAETRVINYAREHLPEFQAGKDLDEIVEHPSAISIEKRASGFIELLIKYHP